MRLGSMAYPRDSHRIALKTKENSIATNTKPLRAGGVATKRGDIPATRLGEMNDSIEDAHGSWAIQASDVSLSLGEP